MLITGQGLGLPVSLPQQQSLRKHVYRFQKFTQTTQMKMLAQRQVQGACEHRQPLASVFISLNAYTEANTNENETGVAFLPSW